MKSIGDLFRNALDLHAKRDSSDGAHGNNEETPYLLLGQKARTPETQTTSGRSDNPSTQEIRDYLASLAKAYDLPNDLVSGCND